VAFDAILIIGRAALLRRPDLIGSVAAFNQSTASHILPKFQR
jgi:hypothetical protein